MKEELTYTEAFERLQKIVSRMESASISVDDLSDNIRAAAELVRICREKLTKAEEEANKTLATLD